MGRKGIWVGVFGAFSALVACGQTAKNGVAQGGSPSNAGTSTFAGRNGGGHVDSPSAGESSGGTTGNTDEGGSGGVLLGDAGAEDSTTGGTNGGATTGGSGGAPNPVLAVKPSPGCGMPAPQPLGEMTQHTIQTEGVKDANCADKLADGTPVCGPWSVEREYYLGLPSSYKSDKAYPLVIEAPGCGGNGKGVFPLAGVADSIIRVGLTPPPVSIGHGTNPGQHCFDDKEGDDSVEFPFFEKVLDTLKTQLCYDENRVYVSGESSGSWLANELACKYAGDTKGHAVRAVATRDGGLPNEPQWAPTCSGKPVAGLWVYRIDNEYASNLGTKYAINRAMSTNTCVAAVDWDDAVVKNDVMNFPIGNGYADDSCKLIKDCDALYPLVVCARPGSSHVSDAPFAGAAIERLISSLAAP